MSENNLPAAGTYKARRYEAIRIAEAKTGSLCAYLPCELLPIGYQFEHTLTLYKADGTSMTGNIQTLQQAFPAWTVNADGELNPFDLAEIPLGEEGKAEFKLADCYHHEHNGKTYFKAQWFNALGREEAAPEEINAIKSKWSAKFKQAAALVKTPTTPVAKPTPAPAPAPVVEAEVVKEVEPKAKSERKASKVATKAKYETAESLYDALVAANPNMDADSIANNLYYPACDKALGKDNQPTTPEECEKVAAELGL